MENSYERGKVFGLEAFSDFPSDSLYGYHNTDFFISSFKGFLLSTRYQLRVRKLSSLMLPIFFLILKTASTHFQLEIRDVGHTGRGKPFTSKQTLLVYQQSVDFHC